MESVPVHREPLVLLKDFDSSYDNFPLKIVNIDPEIHSRIVDPLEEALRSCVARLDTYNLEDLRALGRKHVDERYFIVTMDGGTYFIFHDFSIEMTRACLKLHHSASGPYFRLPREFGAQFFQQALRLKKLYDQEGSGKPIALCDDGIGTGNSARKIISVLDDLNLRIGTIFVFINPRNVPAIGNVDVETLIPTTDTPLWLSERDLYWGLPRSGLSFSLSDEMNPVYGIPYTISTAMVEERIGIMGDAATWFREQCIRSNIAFWELLEHFHNRELLIKDCQRLGFLSEITGDNETRIVTFLRDALHLDGRIIVSGD